MFTLLPSLPGKKVTVSFRNSFREQRLGLRKVTQWAKHLAHKQKDLSSIPEAHVESNAWHVLAIPRTGEELRQVDIWNQPAGQPSLFDELRFSERPCLKQTRWIVPKER